MRSLACSLLDVVLADAILIPPRPPIPPTNIKTVRGHLKAWKLKMPVSTRCYIPTSLPQEKLIYLIGKVPAKGIFSIIHSYFETLCEVFIVYK